MTDKLKSRKFILASAVLAAATALLAFQSIDQDAWMKVISVTFGFYAAGNVGEHFADKRRSS